MSSDAEPESSEPDTEPLSVLSAVSVETDAHAIVVGCEIDASVVTLFSLLPSVNRDDLGELFVDVEAFKSSRVDVVVGTSKVLSESESVLSVAVVWESTAVDEDDDEVLWEDRLLSVESDVLEDVLWLGVTIGKIEDVSVPALVAVVAEASSVGCGTMEVEV